MGRERVEFLRESNSVNKEKIFVLAFEGNATEEKYFQSFKDSVKFNDEQVFLKLLTRHKKDTKSAPNHVFAKLKREAKDEYTFGNDDELWMIIDTDKWQNIPKIAEDCVKENNMFMAVSNPCFEFWLLLHIKNITEYSPDEQKEIFANSKLSKHGKTYVERKLTEILGSYNKTNPLPNRFLGGLKLAIDQAKKLDNGEEPFPSQLGSHVYKLIEKIKSPND